MRAKEFTIESTIGTTPKRPARAGSRPDRGHKTEPRYKSYCDACDRPKAECVCDKLDEKASRALCVSSTPDKDLGASNLASCKSQGLRARDGNKSHKLGSGPESRVKVGGHKLKGKKYGGKLPDWS